MSNVVFQVNIKGHRAKDEFQYSTKSWAKWCELNNFEHFVLTEPIYDLNYMNANWHKFFVLEMLENENIPYENVCIVDADTIVHPKCPNFFDEVGTKLPGPASLTDGNKNDTSAFLYKSESFLEVIPINFIFLLRDEY